VSERPRVSIVTPVFNGERFLAEAIESVLAQTFARWELLIVDDGSTDGSAEIARQYAAAMPAKIRCLSHDGRDNRGASASRNLGIQHASGEYLAFLDADDVYLPRKLGDQVRILDEMRDAHVLYAATEYWHSWTGVADDRSRDWTWHPHGVEIDRIVAAPRALVAFLRDGGTVPCMGSMLVRLAAVQDAGGWEDAFRTICTDQVFHAKLLVRASSVFVDTCWDRYRQHPDSACQRVAAAGRTEETFATYLRWLDCYLADRGIADGALREALDKALRVYDPPLIDRVARRVSHHTRQIGDLFGRARDVTAARHERRR
jgi:glycosyltransferase involved in cell wall biosynthesis